MAHRPNKTRLTNADVMAFIGSVSDAQKQADCLTLVDLMQDISGEPPKMWGPTMIGFGQYHYKYTSGHEGDYFPIGFSPRKTALTLYFMEGFDSVQNELAKLGPHTTSKGCLYIKRLSDIDMAVLKKISQNLYQQFMKRQK